MADSASSSDGFDFAPSISNFAVAARQANSISNTVAVHTATMALDIQSNAMILARERSLIKLPWEVGFGARMFGKAPPLIPFTSLAVPRLPAVSTDFLPKEDPTLPSKVFVKRPAVPFVMRKLRSIDVPYDGDALKLRAINRWRIVIELDLGASDVGKQLTEYIEDGKSDILIIGILEDVFANKKASTLNKRASSLLRYLRWCKIPESRVASSFNFLEQDCYRFLTFLKLSGAKPTAAKSFRESLNFTMHTLGMPQISAAMKSSRITGSAMGQLAKKRPLQQAPAYTVDQVRLLHHILESAEDDRDKCMSGYSLFNMYSCGRFSDSMFPTKFVNDLDEIGFGFLELYTLDHKVATNAERRSVFLPLISISPGLARTPWAPLWLEARERMGLVFCKGPTMPAPSSDGGWVDRPLSASEGAQWIRELFLAYGPKSLSCNRVTSHSGKATILSWASKFGMDKSYRKCLGHHLEAGELSVTTYSRSALDQPLQAVVHMLQMINDKKFDPDSSRLHRQKMARMVLNSSDPYVGFNHEADESVQGAEWEHCSDAGKDNFERFEAAVMGESPSKDSAEVNACEDSDVSSQSSISSESSSDDSVDEGVTKDDEKAQSELSPLCHDRPNPFVDSAGIPLTVMQHIHSGTLHCRREPARLFCNRIVSHSYTVVTKLKLQWPVCAQCRAKVPVVNSILPVSKAQPLRRV